MWLFLQTCAGDVCPGAQALLCQDKPALLRRWAGLCGLRPTPVFCHCMYETQLDTAAGFCRNVK